MSQRALSAAAPSGHRPAAAGCNFRASRSLWRARLTSSDCTPIRPAFGT